MAEGDIVALTDAMEKIGSMQESESKAASDYDATESIGKNVTNSSLYGVSKKKEKVKRRQSLKSVVKSYNNGLDVNDEFD